MLIEPFNTYDVKGVADPRDLVDDLAKIRAVLDGAVSAINLAADAVTTAKIAAEAITTAKIADLAVDTAKIAVQAVTTDKIADGAVTNAKIPAGGLNGDRFATASHALGDGTDGTKAGLIKGLYRTIRFSALTNTVQTFDHDLGTTDLIGFIEINRTYQAPSVVRSHFHSFSPNGANQFDLQCTSDRSGNYIDLTMMILYY